MRQWIGAVTLVEDVMRAGCVMDFLGLALAFEQLNVAVLYSLLFENIVDTKAVEASYTHPVLV